MKTNKGIGMTAAIVIIVAIVLVVGGFYAMYSKNSQSIPTPTPSQSATSSPSPSQTGGPSPSPISTMDIDIPLLVDAGSTGFPNAPVAGCDKVVMTSRTIDATSTPLSAAYKELFMRKEAWPYGINTPGNFITAQKKLSFSSVTIVSKIAKVYLVGTPTYAGVCDDPRLTTVITRTALQFPTVTSVEIYVNGKTYTMPSEK